MERIKRDWAVIQERVATLLIESKKIEISGDLITFLIIAEDHRFGLHPGVDLISLFRALYKTFFLGNREGGSTIAMQLVRVLTGRYERTIFRKFQKLSLL